MPSSCADCNARFRAFDTLAASELSITGDEAAIDVILPAPHPSCLDRPSAAHRDGVALARRDYREGVPLRDISHERHAQCRTPEVGREHRPLPYREDARLRTWVAILAGTVAGGEDVGMGHRLQVSADTREALRVAGETARRKPRGR